LLPQDEAIQTLTDLGLTVLQSKVYLALSKLHCATGKEIASRARVASQDVYRILTELQEKSMIKKIIARPNKYQAFPLQEAFKTLLQERTEQTTKLEHKTREIIQNVADTDKDEDENKMHTFVLTPKDKPLHAFFARKIETTQASFDFAVHSFQDAIEPVEEFLEQYMRVMERGVKFRYLINRPRETVHLPQRYLTLMKQPLFQVRYVRALQVAFILRDRKEVIFGTNLDAPGDQQPLLITDNPTMVRIAKDWFDMMWKKAAENTTL
jgi:sugar-specific transcriptional regulator TrmB